MFKSLKLQLLFYFSIANIIILLVFSLFLYSTAEKGVSDTIDTQLKIISSDVIPDLKGKVHVDAKDIATELMHEFEIAPLYTKIIYYNKKQNYVEYTDLSSEQQAHLFKIPLDEKGHLHSIYYFDKERYRVSSMLLFEDDDIKVFFQLATKKIINSPYLNELLLSLLIANPVIFILFIVIVNMLINRTLLPVQDVIDSVHDLSADQLTQRIDSKNVPTEIEELVQTFNRLLANIEEAFNRITTFSSDASHELKTPLTVIRGEIEVALRKNRTPAEYKAVLEDVFQETLRVQETIDKLFLLTKKDTAELTKDFQELYLDELLTDLIAQTEKFASTRSVTIKAIHMIPATICASETLLKIAFNNLLRNAVIYSKDGGEIRISLDEEEHTYLLTIEDDGYGIPAQDLPFVFERFYRADKARSRKEGGTGLGLAIVKMILDIHHYDINIQSKVDHGTTVSIKISK
jgi:heavy metal sensor kinase